MELETTPADDSKEAWVVHPSGNFPVFQGSAEDAVKFLEENESENPRWVYVTATADILTESEFLDLAT
jgi:hypothetical protein